MLPYQLLFPIGLAYAIAGLLVWALFAAGMITTYPASLHAPWMIGGFLMSFSAGFLMTAMPRFTGGTPCRRSELGVAAAIAIGQILHSAFTPLLFLFLLVFAFRRFKERQYSPPPHFVFVGLGLLLGLLGSLGMSLSEWGIVSPVPIAASRIYLLQGVLLCFVVGIGARLVRVLLGYEPSPLVQISRVGEKPKKTRMFPSETRFQVFGSFALMLLGFACESVSGFETVGRVLRALATSWIAISAWRLHRFPPRKGSLAWGLYFACWSIALGVWAYALFPGWEVHSAHVLFVGGFGVLAVLVASRVILAHGGHAVVNEQKSWAIRATWILLLLGMVARVSAPVTGGYVAHLGYAAIISILALLIWAKWMSAYLRHSRENIVPH